MTATGVGTLNYLWGAGGGGTFSSFVTATTNLTLGSPGAYTATVVVSDSGGTTTGSINYTVDAAAITINGVTPGTEFGLPGAAVVLGVDFDGVATDAAWEFDDGTVEATATGLTPTVHLKEVGTYTGRVTLSNAITTETFEFTFYVGRIEAPTWTIMDLGAALDLTFDQRNTAMINQAGRLTILYNSPDGLKLARAQTEVPTGPSDWITTVVAADGRAFGPRTVALYQDRLVALYYTKGEFTYLNLRCAVALVAEPTGPSDWLTFPITNGSYPSGPTALAQVEDGLLMAVPGQVVNGISLRLIWAAAMPDDESDLVAFERSTTESNGVSQVNDIATIDGHTYVQWGSYDPPYGVERFAKLAIDATGGVTGFETFSGDGESTTGGGEFGSMLDFGGKIGVGYINRRRIGSPFLAIRTFDETDIDDLTTYTDRLITIPGTDPNRAEYIGRSAAMVDGRPVFPYQDYSQGRLWVARAIRLDFFPSPEPSAAWLFAPVDTGGNVPSLALAGDRIAIAHTAGFSSGRLRVAIANAAF
ncbi:MAG: hypothetical protein ABI743_02400 [bacterium]